MAPFSIGGSVLHNSMVAIVLALWNNRELGSSSPSYMVLDTHYTVAHELVLFYIGEAHTSMM